MSEQEKPSKSYQINIYNDKGELVGQSLIDPNMGNKVQDSAYQQQVQTQSVQPSSDAQSFFNKQLSQEERDNFFSLQMSASENGVISPGQHQAHPLSLVANMLQGISSAAVVFIILIVTNPLSLLTFLPVVFLFVLALVGSFISYKFNTFELTDGGIRLRNGIIFKSDRQIPYEKIHAVNTVQGVLDRILGLSKVTLETASSTEGFQKVSYLKKIDAEALKQELFQRKVHALSLEGSSNENLSEEKLSELAQDDPAIAEALANKLDSKQSSIANTLSSIGNVGGLLDHGQQIHENEAVLYEHKLTNKELILTAVSEASALGIIAGFAVFGLNFFNQFSSFIGDYFSNQFDQFEHFLESPDVLDILISFAPRIVIAIVASIILFWIISTIINVLNYGGFSVSRKANYFEVKRGLIALRSKTVALNRVQAVRMKQGFIRRRLGYTQVAVVTVQQVLAEASSGNSGQSELANSVIIHPFIKVSEVPSFLSEALPEFSEIPYEKDLEKLPKPALRRAFLRKVYAFAVSAICVGIYLYFSHYIPAEVEMYITPAVIALCLISFMLELISAGLNYKHARMGVKHKHYAAVKGGLTKVYTAVNRNKIQEVSYTQNPFQKRLDLATLEVTTAAGSSSDNFLALRDVNLTQAIDVIEWFRPRHDNTKEALVELNKQDLLNVDEEEALKELLGY